MNDFLASLIGTESGGNWAAANNVPGAGGMAGHFGRLQFGQARLQDAMRAGVLPQGTTPQQFMADPALQQRVEQWHFADIDRRARDMGLLQYVGQTIAGVPITQDAIRAMAHLGGIGGAARFLQSGGEYNPSDAYGTSLLDYARTHGNAGGMTATMSTRDAGGQAMPTPGLLSQPQRAPTIWDRIGERVPVLRGLANPDTRARLAIALEGMTTNPNQAFIQTLQSDMQNRQEEERINRTVEWLSSQPGGGPFAEAIAAGMEPNAAYQGYVQSMQAPAPVAPVEINGQLVDPTTGQVIGDYRTPEAPGEVSSIVTGEQAAALGLDPALRYNVTQGPEGIRATQIGGTAPTTNVNVAPGESAFASETGKTMAQEAARIVDQGMVAQRSLGQLTALRDQLSQAPQGFTGALIAFAGERGIDIGGLDNVQAAQAIIAQLVPLQRPPGSGQMSDRDVELFKQSVPRIINQPGGNQIILDTMINIAEYDVARMNIARRQQLGEITAQQAVSEYAALGNPIPGELLGGETSVSAMPAPAPGATQVFNYDPATGQFTPAGEQ